MFMKSKLIKETDKVKRRKKVVNFLTSFFYFYFFYTLFATKGQKFKKESEFN